MAWLRESSRVSDAPAAVGSGAFSFELAPWESSLVSSASVTSRSSGFEVPQHSWLDVQQQHTAAMWMQERRKPKDLCQPDCTRVNSCECPNAIPDEKDVARSSA